MRTFFHLVLREFKRVFSRRSALVIILIVPLIVFFYLGSIYVRGSIEKVSIMVVNLDKEGLSNKILSTLGSSPKVEIVEYEQSVVQPEKVFLDYPHIKGILILPQGLTNSVYQGRQTEIKVYTNSSNIIYGNLIYKEIATFINTVSAGISLNYLVLEGLPIKAAENLVLPVRVQAKPLFNPYYNYLYYLLPGLTSVLLQMIVFFLAARSMNSEIKDESFSGLLELSGNRTNLILGSKLLAYTLIGMCIAVFIYAVVHPVMGIPTSISILRFLPFLLLFVMTNVMLGMMISLLFTNEAIAMDTAFVYNSPAFVFSGFTYPILAMPSFESWYAQLIPYTHFLKAFTKTVEMQGTLKASAYEAGVLLIFFLIGYLVFVFGLERKIENRLL
jgi:ABC-2 type transport system permease protein